MRGGGGRGPPRGGGGGRGFGGGGRSFGGGRGGGGGGGGFYNEGPPESVMVAGVFAHACEGEAVVKLTNDKVSRNAILHFTCMLRLYVRNPRSAKQLAGARFTALGLIWTGTKSAVGSDTVTHPPHQHQHVFMSVCTATPKVFWHSQELALAGEENVERQ